MIAGNADEDKAGEREDTVSHLTIECAVTIHPRAEKGHKSLADTLIYHSDPLLAFPYCIPLM